MAGENDEIVVELEAPTAGAGDQGGAAAGQPGEAAKPAAAPSTEDGIEALRSQLAGERQGRIEAERRAATAASQAHDSNLALVTNGIATLKATQSQLKAAYADALAAQDYDAAADIQLKMTEAATSLKELERGEVALKAKPKPEPHADPVEALAAQLSPKSAAWVRAHPEYASDARQYRRMIAAHNLAMADGHPEDSPAYFAAVERTLGISGGEERRAAPAATQQDDDATAAAAQVTGGRQAAAAAAPPAAPVRGSGGGSGGTGGGTRATVRLSAAEREIADNNGMTYEEYAKNKLQLQREGKLH